VASRAKQRGAAVGYKIALSSKAMQSFVGVDSPQAGVILESTLHRSPARIRAADYVGLIVEFEIAVEMAADLPAADAPFSRDEVAAAVGSVMPAIEIADDRNADYARIREHPLHLIADNAWNEGAVLGAPIAGWRSLDLGKIHAAASINGDVVGTGVGAEAMGHPFDSVAWVAAHLATRGHGLLRGEVVITGSLVTSKRVNAGDRVSFALQDLGTADLYIE
ncbi:MAG TPA: fumarylacetoacetate hydrolase family protein, partial [Burkholderiales bacterium]